MQVFSGVDSFSNVAEDTYPKSPLKLQTQRTEKSKLLDHGLESVASYCCVEAEGFAEIAGYAHCWSAVGDVSQYHLPAFSLSQGIAERGGPRLAARLMASRGRNSCLGDRMACYKHRTLSINKRP